MRPKPSILLLATVACLCVSLQDVAAQGNQEEISPLIVTGQFSTALGADCKSGKGLVLQFHYAGTQALRGYLVTIALTDLQAGKVLTEQTFQEARDSRGPMIVDGAEWTRTSCSIVETIAGHVLNVITKVDVLKFVDGSIGAPRHCPRPIDSSVPWMVWTSA